MKISDAITRLKQLEAMLASWNCKSTDLADLIRLADALEPFSELSVVEFSKLLARLNDNGAPTTPKSQKKPAVSQEIVSSYASKLLLPGLSRVDALELLAVMKADKSAKLAELAAIADAVAGSAQKFNKRADALSAIERWIRRRFDTIRDLDGTSGTF